MTDQQIEQLLNQQQTIIEKLSKTKEKDRWDKLSTLSTFLSSIVIAVIGVYFANVYKSQEVRIGEMQVIEKLLPILAGSDEKVKKGALLTIANLSNQDLAINIGTSYVSSGTVEAMEILFNTSKGEKKEMLRDSLISAYYSRSADPNATLDDIIADIEKIFKLKSPEDLREKQDGYYLANLYANLGYAYRLLNKYNEAELTYNKSLESYPNFYRANWGLAALYWERKDSQHSLEKALEYYNLAVAYEGDPEVYYSRAKLNYEMLRYDEALADLRQYLINRPNAANGYIGRAAVYEAKGEYLNAKQELETALKYADDGQKADIQLRMTDLELSRKRSRKK